MIPQLQAAYGGPPESWLTIPEPLFWAYVRMLPRIDAAESDRLITCVAIATGHMEEDARDEYISDLRKAFKGDRRRKAQPITPDVLREIGAHIRE